MDEGITFGEVEEESPQKSLRPDQNKHFAVAAYEAPKDGDLPIFVDLDVVQDMEDHAQSDTSVELGGVLLGGTFMDEEGHPFVVITDSLRAEHYESTKGSFKFTHDTWSAITREREQFPDELQMVGWYHTHPDWGVFLSGMDMFICDNFFNKKLDVAFVIDPCRGDRGMFQWTGDPRQRVRRTGGFFVTASRFRAGELEHYVAELSGKMPASTISSSRGQSAAGAPVIHLHQPAQQQPPWQGAAVLGMLALQFALVALIAWKLAGPSAQIASDNEDPVVASLEKLRDSFEERTAAEKAADQARAQLEVLDHVVSELKGTDEGFVQRLEQRFDETSRLSDDVAARDSQIREQQRLLEDTRSRLAALETKSKNEEDRLQARIASLNDQVEKLRDENDELDAKLTKYEPKKKPSDADSATLGDGEISLWWYIAGGILAAAVIVPGVWWMTRAFAEKADGEMNERAEATQPK